MEGLFILALWIYVAWVFGKLSNAFDSWNHRRKWAKGRLETKNWFDRQEWLRATGRDKEADANTQEMLTVQPGEGADSRWKF